MPKKQEDALPKLGKLDLGDDNYRLNLDRFLAGDYENIEDAAAELPAILEWLNINLQIFDQQKGESKRAVAQAEARAYMALRGGAFAERGFTGKPTEEAIKHAIALDPDVIAAEKSLSEDVAWVNRIRQLIGNISLKIDLVRSSESTKRKIYNTTEPD